MSELDKSDTSVGFFNYVFNFDNENKMNIMNMLQYTVLAIIPVLLILKATKYFIPEEDDSKGSLEILVESVGQIIMIMLAIWFTNKIIRYIPTYSGTEYHIFNEINFIIPFLIILATMQTKLGAKLNILLDRVLQLWNGSTKAATGQQGNNNVRVIQPFAGPQQQQTHQPSQADYLDRNQLLPNNAQLTAMPQMMPQPQQQQQQPQQQQPNFNQMYQQQEPMAANDALGGGMFGGSAW